MSSISNLNNLASIARLWRGKPAGKKSFKFNWSTGYIQQVGYSWGVVTKQNDWSRDYWQCYWGYFNIWDSAVHGLDNRSVQTMKFVFQIDDNLNNVSLWSYNWYTTVNILTTWQIQVEIQWTWSARINTTETITAWTINSVVVKVNNTLPSGTARVVGDVDIFINWVKATKTLFAISNNTTTTSILNWWAYNSTTTLFRWRLYNFNLWNRALSDAECQAEWLSNRSVVTPSWLVNTWDTTDTSQAISRTWYNLTWSGNYSVGTDADGKYILFDGNRDWVWATWTLSNIWATSWLTPTYNQTTNFTIKVRLKHITNPATWVSWFFWSSNDACIWVDWSWNIQFTVRWSTTVTYWWSVLTAWVLYDAYLVRDATQTKFFAYVWTAWWASSLINSWWTTWPTTFSTDWRCVWDAAVGTWSFSSSKKQIYHTRIRARALTQSDINADIALWNNTNNDPTIVASYRPDNLINQQFMSNPKSLENVIWTKWSWTSVVANNATAPDWTATADTVTRTWTNTTISALYQTDTTLTGSSTASKTFIVKAFCRATSGTQAFRLNMTHPSVAAYFSTDQTATTTRQEFTFSQAFTSSTSWTWVQGWITCNVAWSAGTLEVRNVRVFLVNEILYDNSPNIGGYVWPLINRYISWWIKPWVDALNDASGNPIMNLWYWYSYIRATTNWIRMRFDTRAWAVESFQDLWSWFRNRVHFIGWVERDWTNFRTKVWINWVVIDTDTWFLDASHTFTNNTAQILLWRFVSRYYTWSTRDSRIFTSPTALTDAQALMITNWGDPMDVTKVLHRDVVPSDTTNYVTDKSGNGRVGYITWGVTKTF